MYIKEAHPQTFIPVFMDIFHAMWENGKDVSKPEVLAEVLSGHFTDEQVKQVMDEANSAPYKQRLNDNTKEALDRGAFGCPWFSVRNSKGDEEPFFGSDRYVPFRISSSTPAITRMASLLQMAGVAGRSAFSLVAVAGDG